MSNPFTIKQARSKNAAVLEQILALGLDDEVSQTAASNKHCPSAALALVMARTPLDSVAEIAASNPNCPVEVLGSIIQECKDNWRVKNAIRNPNAPSKALGEVLSRMVSDELSWLAYRHPNAPAKEKLQWFMKYPKEVRPDKEIQHNTQPNYSTPEKPPYFIPTFKEWIGKDSPTKSS